MSMSNKQVNSQLGRSIEKPRGELMNEMIRLIPSFRKTAGFAMIGGLLLLSPTFYMQEVYDRVVNSRNTTTLLMLTLFIFFAMVYNILIIIVENFPYFQRIIYYISSKK